jgi:putative two-component system response regulator
MGSGLTEDLESLVQHSGGVSGADLKVTLSRLAAELKERFHKGTPNSYDFVIRAVRALTRIKGKGNAEVRMSCLWDGGVFLFSNGFDKEALECADELNLLAQQSSDQFWLRKSYLLKGIGHAHIGDSGGAITFYSRALELAKEANDYEAMTSALGNIGTCLNYCGLHREAIPCITATIQIARNHPLSSSFETAALCNLAQSYLYLGEFEEGFRYITSCLERSEEPTDSFSAFSRVVREYTYVQLALELGKLGAARKHAQLACQYAQTSQTKRSEFLASVCRALCEIHGGDVSKGLAMLETALQSANERGNAEYVDALKALVKGYDLASRPQEALDRLNLLLMTIRESRQRAIAALFSSESPDALIKVVAESNDLQEFKFREASLRAQVAEREVISSRIEMLERLAITSDLKEEASGEHGYRVGKLSALIASKLAWQREAELAIELAARLHDIGKIAVPDRILLSSQQLQDAERHFISAHTIIGAELLAKSNIPQLRMAEEIARHHHEWWNGEGYPSKLAGKRIPIHARIVAIADVFDALTHGRPFSAPWTMDRAIEEIRNRRGTQFDPELTDLFLGLIAKLRAEHQDLDEYLGRAGRNSPFLQARNKIREMLAAEREIEKQATVEGNATRH